MTSLNSATGEERTNKHRGSNFDDFLRDQGIFDETHAKASKRARIEQIDDALQCNQRVRNKLPTLPG